MNVELSTVTRLNDAVIEAPSLPQLSMNLQFLTFRVPLDETIAPMLEESLPEQLIKVTLFSVSLELEKIAEPAP